MSLKFSIEKTTPTNRTVTPTREQPPSQIGGVQIKNHKQYMQTQHASPRRQPALAFTRCSRPLCSSQTTTPNTTRNQTRPRTSTRRTNPTTPQPEPPRKPGITLTNMQAR
jgi:hypothetical protein